MSIDHEAEYNNRIRIADYPAIIARWRSLSTADREAASARTDLAELDRPYGPGERQRYDLYRSGEPGAPLIIYIHGGYWQLGSRQDTAFVARAFNAAGIDIALPSYSLCPEVTVIEIIDEIRRCVVALWAATGKRPVVAGHSAGGHLTAAMLATDWGTMPGVPRDLVRAGLSISGVFELAPLIPTTMNRALRLDAATAAAASPILWAPPPAGGALVAALGAEETPEFHRQSRAIAERWGTAGIATEVLAIAGANHFTVVDELTRPDSALFTRLVALARA
ncbi:MAG TPA: alpha/beta hydrolase [Kofleriaceae bacterium]|nr:alpha/beta hydrolase [Kofleriaceae bacterium]